MQWFQTIPGRVPILCKQPKNHAISRFNSILQRFRSDSARFRIFRDSNCLHLESPPQCDSMRFHAIPVNAQWFQTIPRWRSIQIVYIKKISPSNDSDRFQKSRDRFRRIPAVAAIIFRLHSESTFYRFFAILRFAPDSSTIPNFSTIHQIYTRESIAEDSGVSCARFQDFRIDSVRFRLC